MTWEELTTGQIQTVFLEDRPQYETLRKKLRELLRNQNMKETNLRKEEEKKGAQGTKLPRKYPLALMAYALAVVAAWHAASVKKASLDSIDVAYLENQYFLKNLFWEKTDDPKNFDFPRYLTLTVRSGEGTPGERAARCLDHIKGTYIKGPFQPDMTLKKLLDWIIRENKQAKVEWPLSPSLESLEEVLKSSIRAEILPAGPRREPPETPRFPIIDEIRGLLENDVKQIILTGAPGTGKTYAAKQLAQRLGAPLGLDQSGRPRAYTLVQFHPSYDYTDFVEGLRPVQRGGQIPFAKLDGSFKAFCRRVVTANRDDPDWESKKYFFLIDEINRAELSKVFGELMCCLDQDKRGPDHRVQTQYQNLNTYDLDRGDELTKAEDVFSDGFYIPENVYLIGTMNDIDRSVESMDFALRRRFTLREVVVTEELLTCAFSAMGFGGNVKKLTDHVLRLNSAMEADGAGYGLNRQYFISQGHFANLSKAVQKTGPEDKIRQYVWTFRLETLLREYLRGMDESRINKFVASCQKAFWPEGIKA